jgi:hypothetical protein
MKEATSILELALWKKRINDTKLSHQQKTNQTEGACIRQQCRVTCGAEFIIGHVVPYLISIGDDDSSSYKSNSDVGSSYG